MKPSTPALALALALSLAACGGGSSGSSADSPKTTEEVQAEAQKADAGALRASVAKYQEAVAGKQGELDAVLAQIKGLDAGAALSGKGAELKMQADKLRDEQADLQAKLQIYLKELSKKSAGP